MICLVLLDSGHWDHGSSKAFACGVSRKDLLQQRSRGHYPAFFVRKMLCCFAPIRVHPGGLRRQRLYCALMVDVKDSLDRAARLLQTDDLTKARALCHAAVGAAPRNARAHFLLGAIDQRADRTKDAASHALKAARLRPDLSALQTAAGSLLLRGKAYHQALEIYEAAVQTHPSVAGHHLGAASALRKLGRNTEATASLRSAAAADPGSAQVQYKLGQHLRSVGCVKEATEAYQHALQLNPDHPLAAFWLASTRKVADEEGHRGTESRSAENKPPATAPQAYVVALYNSYADTFDAHLQGSLAYRTPRIVMENLAALLPGRRYRRCLDLGCGTGLSGEAASPYCDVLVGVDLSPAMVRQAREKNIYQRLLVGDVTNTILSIRHQNLSSGTEWHVPQHKDEHGCGAGPSESGSVGGAIVETGGGGAWSDLVLSCDVFVYIGDLRPCFEAVRDLVLLGAYDVGGDEADANSAVFAFSVEAPPFRLDNGGNGGDEDRSGDAMGRNIGYELQGTGRYTHSRRYLHDVCRNTGFRVLASDDVVLRRNAGVPVHGYVFVAEVCR